MTPITLLFLYIIFRLKQFMCDFILQTDWMALGKGAPGKEFVHPLMSHIMIHSMATLVIVLFFAPSLWWLAVADFAIHGAIDRLKGIVTYKNKWSPQDTMFWWAFAVDQELHNFTHLAYIVAIVWHLGGITL